MKTKLRWESNNPFESLDGKDGEGNEVREPLSVQFGEDDQIDYSTDRDPSQPC